MFRVPLQPTGKRGDPIIRLRRFLKSALRGFGFRCVVVEDLRAAPTADKPGSATAEPGTVRMTLGVSQATASGDCTVSPTPPRLALGVADVSDPPPGQA